MNVKIVEKLLSKSQVLFGTRVLTQETME
jgi:hypothetical protein